MKVGKKKVFQLEDFHIGEIYEVASMYTAGVSKCVRVRDTYECIEITVAVPRMRSLKDSVKVMEIWS